MKKPKFIFNYDKFMEKFKILDDCICDKEQDDTIAFITHNNILIRNPWDPGDGDNSYLKQYILSECADTEIIFVNYAKTKPETIHMYVGCIKNNEYDINLIHEVIDFGYDDSFSNFDYLYKFIFGTTLFETLYDEFEKIGITKQKQNNKYCKSISDMTFEIFNRVLHEISFKTCTYLDSNNYKNDTFFIKPELIFTEYNKNLIKLWHINNI